MVWLLGVFVPWCLLPLQKHATLRLCLLILRGSLLYAFTAQGVPQLRSVDHALPLLPSSLCLALSPPASWTAIEHSLLKLGEILANLSNPQLRSQAERCGTLIRRLGFCRRWEDGWAMRSVLPLTLQPPTLSRASLLSIPTMLSVHSEQLHKTGFPTVHALILLEGTMNLTGEMQPLVEQLMMVKRMQVGVAKQGGWPLGVRGRRQVLRGLALLLIPWWITDASRTQFSHLSPRSWF